MKHRIIALITVLLVMLAAASVSAEEITGEQLKSVLDSSLFINLFDVRTPDEYAAGTIPAAENLPLSELESTMRGILDNGFSNMAVDVYVYGATAEDSASAAEILAGLGFTNVHYLPGISAWTWPLSAADLLLGDLNTTDIYGKAVDGSLIADSKLVMVNVWATYCNPCISEMEGLGNLSRKLKEKGVMIVGLVSDCQNSDLSAKDSQLETARLIAESTKADYPHLLPNRAMYRDIMSTVQAVPTTFFVNGQGQMVGSVYVGSRSEADWETIINETLGQLE